MAKYPSGNYKISPEEQRIMEIEERLKDHSDRITKHEASLIRGEGEFKACATAITNLKESVDEVRSGLKMAIGSVLLSVLASVLSIILKQ